MFSQEFRAAVDTAASADGPYLTIIDAIPQDDFDYQQALESQVVDFINELKARGVI